MVALVIVLAAALSAVNPLRSPEIEPYFNAPLLDSPEIEPYFNAPVLDSGCPSNDLIRIVGGHTAHPDQFRHQAKIVGDNRKVFGGSLIKPTAILTSGRCVAKSTQFTIRLGTILRKGPDDSLFTVESIWGLVHPEYNTGAYFNNDVAVILLNVDVPLGRSIWPVKLPSFYEINKSFTGRRALISGFGSANDSAKPLPKKLRYTAVTVISNDLCKRFYNEDYILESTLCAGNAYTAISYGDYGGALVIKSGGRYKQIGVASFTAGSCLRAAPGVFARVTSFLEWIQRAAGELDDWEADEYSYYN